MQNGDVHVDCLYMHQFHALLNRDPLHTHIMMYNLVYKNKHIYTHVQIYNLKIYRYNVVFVSIYHWNEYLGLIDRGVKRYLDQQMQMQMLAHYHEMLCFAASLKKKCSIFHKIYLQTKFK